MKTCPWKGLTFQVGAALALFGAAPVYAAECPPYNYSYEPTSGFSFISTSQVSPDETTSEAADTVSWELTPAPLRPQVESLLREQWGVQNIVWYAEQGHFWPTNYTLKAPNWDSLLSRILSPYQLRVKLHSNHTAVIDYLPGMESAQ